MSNPPWATDVGFNAGPKNGDSNLRTSDINIPYRKKMQPRFSSSLKTNDVVIPRRKHLNRNWDGHGVANLNTGDIVGQHNRLKHQMGPGVTQYGSGFKPRYSLEVRDIDGAYARRKRDPRHTSPLDPQYKLPSHKQAPPPEMKYLRDNIHNSDISGAQVTNKYNQIQTRQTNKVEDIRGTKSLPQTFTRTFGQAADVLDHRDITATEFKTKRLGHNPLEPTYTFGRSSDLNMATILDIPASEALKAKMAAVGPLQKGVRPNQLGDFKGSKPTPLKAQKELAHRSYNLRTSDVPGAFTGWTPDWQPPRKDFSNPTRTDDIIGAQAGTKKKLTTRRSLHPLSPKYKTLDGHVGPRKRGQLQSTGRKISQVVLG
mmetsp:Transcript_8187/g.13260  ORF Transcript_8187/g.13260 Transcript_8187/m.13260 type:complete len:371 (-) Transcript_8187:192-1304(-)